MRWRDSFGFVKWTDLACVVACIGISNVALEGQPDPGAPAANAASLGAFTDRRT